MTLDETIASMLEMDKDYGAIQAATGASFTRIKRVYTLQQQQKEQDAIATLVHADPSVVHKVLEKVQGELPSVTLEDMKAVGSDLEGLAKLDRRIQQSAIAALKRGDMFLEEENTKLTPSQWKTIVDGIATLYTAVFVQQGTNINIMNNNGDSAGSAVNSWKGSLR